MPKHTVILLACLSGVAYTLWKWHAQIVARINRLRAAALTWLARWRRTEEPDKPVAEAPIIISAPMSSTLPPRIGTLFARGCLHSVAYPSAAVLAQAARGAAFSIEEDEEERTEPEKDVHHPAPMLLRSLSPLFPLDTTLQSSSGNDDISSPPTPVQFRQHPGTPVMFQVVGSLIDSRPMN